MLTNAQVGGDPVTPVFFAAAGQEIRIRMLQPGGHPRNDNYMLHGHIWESEPYIDSSQTIGSNPLSNWVGSQGGVGPGTHFDFIPKGGAGGRFRVPGDYLYRTFSHSTSMAASGDHTDFAVQHRASTVGLHAMPDRSGMYGRLYDVEFDRGTQFTNNSWREQLFFVGRPVLPSPA